MKLFGKSYLGNRRIGALILLTALLAGGPAALADRKEGNPDLSGTASSVTPTPTPPKFNVPIPPGHDAHGVTIPYYDAKGKLADVF